MDAGDLDPADVSHEEGPLSRGVVGMGAVGPVGGRIESLMHHVPDLQAVESDESL